MSLRRTKDYDENLKIRITLTVIMEDLNDVPETTTDRIRFVLQNVKWGKALNKIF